jgi:hypothetical protein
MPDVKTTPVMVAWDVDSILDAAGGVDRLQNLLLRYCGRAPAYNTICMWRLRRRLPSEWSAAIVYALMRTQQKPFKSLISFETDPFEGLPEWPASATAPTATTAAAA